MEKDILKEILHHAVKMAEKVGEIQMDSFRSPRLKMSTKTSQYDLVTEVDKACEAYLVKEISQKYPEHSIIGEETGKHIHEGAEWEWVVDPLDGTNSYAQGLPVFCVSIGVRYKGEPIVGVVYAPYLDELYTAIKGQGAQMQQGLCMGEPMPGDTLHVSRKTDIGECVVASGFPYDKATNPANNVTNASRVIPRVRGFRRMGSCAYDMCCVAMGTIDVYWELDLKEYDCCAGMVIVQEAGGIIHHFRQDRHISIIAGNETLVNEINKLVE